MRKNAVIFLLLVLTCFSCTSPDDMSKYTKYTADFPKVFDTHTIFIAFTKTEKEFDKYSDMIYDRMAALDKLYDIYNDYDGINNLKTVNDNAGIKPVPVDKDIIDLIKFGITAYEKTDGAVNIAMGSVLRLWHDARIFSLANPDEAYLPDMEQLKTAKLNTNIDDVIVDEKAGTIFLKNPEMSLDVGAIAKGYSAQVAINEAEKAGLKSGILNAGGNVITLGKPMESTRQRWGVSIQNPNKVRDGMSDVDSVYTNSLAVITSGDYQRFYTINGIEYNHIIDPETLMSAARYGSVTILHSDSGVADMLSTALFILPKEQGEQLLKEWDAEALWVEHNGNMSATDGYKAISLVFSNYSNAD